mgnify:CR=1 FL=1
MIAENPPRVKKFGLGKTVGVWYTVEKERIREDYL